jgi:hypothetical protein
MPPPIFLALVFLNSNFFIFFIILGTYMQSSYLKITRNIAGHNQTVGKEKPIFYSKRVNVWLDP